MWIFRTRTEQKQRQKLPYEGEGWDTALAQDRDPHRIEQKRAGAALESLELGELVL
jgi:hypothetical protein